MWLRYDGKVHGVKVEGDKKVPPTRWWNHLYLLFFRWTTVMIFEVSEHEAALGYRVGYLPSDGKTMLEDVVSHDQRFRVRIGHEDCTFFALLQDGEEIKLTEVARTHVRDMSHGDAPLH